MSWVLNKILENFCPSNQNTCLKIGEMEYTYSSMCQYISGIQKLLEQEKDCRIAGIVADNTPETYAAIFACWFSGKGIVFIHPKYPASRNDLIINESECGCVISGRNDHSSFLTEAIPIVHPEKSEKQPGTLDFSCPGPDTVLCILFTSGSTGAPKGVPITLSNIESSLDAFFALDYKLDKRDKFLQMFELTFDMSMLSYLPCFVLGASVFPVDPDKIRYLEALKIMQKEEISFAAMVPSTLSLLQPYFPKIHLPFLKYSLIGGEPFLGDLAEAWYKCIPNASLVNISGPTEITMACMGYSLSRDFANNKTHNGILAFGYPWNNTTAIIVDENNNVLEPEQTGELCFAGRHIMTGYLNKPDLNKKVLFLKEFAGQSRTFYKTGDMAFMDKSGLFFTCGRKDLQVKVQGHRVELEEIENIARRVLGIANVIAFIVEGENDAHQIAMVIESENIHTHEILRILKPELPYYMMPSWVKTIVKFPYNNHGKTDREALKKLFK